MLKTNSKAFMAKLDAFIIENYNGADYENGSPECSACTVSDIAHVVLSDFIRVCACDFPKTGRVDRYGTFTRRAGETIVYSDIFHYYLSTLPGLFDLMELYTASAVDTVAELMQENETEKNRFSETDAERFLTGRIYNRFVKLYPDFFNLAAAAARKYNR